MYLYMEVKIVEFIYVKTNSLTRYENFRDTKYPKMNFHENSKQIRILRQG